MSFVYLLVSKTCSVLEPLLPPTLTLSLFPVSPEHSSIPPPGSSCTPLQPPVVFRWGVGMQSICPRGTCFLSKPWDLQSVFDHRVFAALILDTWHQTVV